MNFHQNARHSFPNRIPKRGKGKTKQQKKAILKAKKEFRKKAKNGPLGLPLAIPNPSGVSVVVGFLINQPKIIFLFSNVYFRVVNENSTILLTSVWRHK